MQSIGCLPPLRISVFAPYLYLASQSSLPRNESGRWHLTIHPERKWVPFHSRAM